MLKPKRLLRRLDRQQQRMVADLGSRSPKQLTHRPSPNAWSALDVLSHLVKVEQGMLHDMRAQLREPPAHVGPITRLRGAAVTLLMWTPARVPIPSAQAARILPETGPDLATLCAQWTITRAGFHDLDYVPVHRRARVFFHAIGGWYTVAGTLSLLLAHTHHHRYQLRRLFGREG